MTCQICWIFFLTSAKWLWRNTSTIISSLSVNLQLNKWFKWVRRFVFGEIPVDAYSTFPCTWDDGVENRTSSTHHRVQDTWLTTCGRSCPNSFVYFWSEVVFHSLAFNFSKAKILMLWSTVMLGVLPTLCQQFVFGPISTSKSRPRPHSNNFCDELERRTPARKNLL